MSALLARFSDVFLRTFEQRLAPRSRTARVRRQPAPQPEPQDWPARFASREEWLAWCEQDRDDEMREELMEYAVEVYGQAVFERRHTQPALVVPIECARCGHLHGGSAYGVCLAMQNGDVCPCNEALRTA